MSLLRAFAATLIVSLLLVPAVTRVGQPLRAARSSTPTPSFHKSVDVPPDPVVVVPDVSARPIVDVLLQPVRRFVRVAAEALPPPPAVVDIRPLRAPPVRLQA